MSTALAPGRQGWLHSRNGGGEGGIGFSCCLCCHNLAQRLRLGGYALTHSCRSNTILKAEQIAAIRSKLSPRILIPMHYRHADLETSPNKPELLRPWFARFRHDPPALEA